MITVLISFLLIGATAKLGVTEHADVSLRLHRVYEYHGAAYFKPKSGTKLVAFEAEIRGGGPWFDADDVQLVGDGHNFGDFPDVMGLGADWKPVKPTVPTNRVRLIYQVPKPCCRSFDLFFEGQKLFPKPGSFGRAPN
jgi:hypothetical protein